MVAADEHARVRCCWLQLLGLPGKTNQGGCAAKGSCKHVSVEELFLVFIGCLAQQFPMGQFRDFSLPEYYDVPHETQMKSLVQGEEALPQGAGQILIKRLKLQTFREDGAGEFIMLSEDCLYDSKQRTATSPGPLQ